MFKVNQTLYFKESVLEKYIAPALIANASTLGIHWIYDYKFIERLAESQEVLFQIQTKEHYDAAESSYLSYENLPLGSVSVQGQMLKWLYRAMREHQHFTQLDYSKLLYQQFKSGGPYHGFVESYAKKHVCTVLAKSLDVEIAPMAVNDDHLVGFVPYLVCKELGLSSDQAWELAQVYTNDEDYYLYYKMFDELFHLLKSKSIQEAVASAISLGPDKYRVALEQAIAMSDPNEFIETHSGRACAIKYSIPLIVHVLSHTTSFEEAIRYNALLGGAVSDRNMLLGAIFAQISEIPKEFKDKVGSAVTL